MALDTLIAERGAQLLSRKRQRIAIASAISANLTIIILDETPSNLGTEREVLYSEKSGCAH
jgi:ABC-type multidrug transport system fused ATPase/permease subunit|tara:strand:+ start:336 stop:518 length:183 start_codon:yes stop_codon:yes gene_type:complete